MNLNNLTLKVNVNRQGCATFNISFNRVKKKSNIQYGRPPGHEKLIKRKISGTWATLSPFS
jgi:hypothetical protein